MKLDVVIALLAALAWAVGFTANARTEDREWSHAPSAWREHPALIGREKRRTVADSLGRPWRGNAYVLVATFAVAAYVALGPRDLPRSVPTVAAVALALVVCALELKSGRALEARVRRDVEIPPTHAAPTARSEALGVASRGATWVAFYASVLFGVRAIAGVA